MRFSWSSTSTPGKSGLPALANSAKMQPADQQSIEVVYSLAPKRTSGGRYQRVTTSAEKQRTGMPKARAKPKSASFSWPLLLLMSKFWGFKSRCRTLWLWWDWICYNDVNRNDHSKLITCGKIQVLAKAETWSSSQHRHQFRRWGCQNISVSKELKSNDSRKTAVISTFKSWSQCSKTRVNFLSLCRTS